MDLILTGRPVDAREAHAIGLANRVVGVGEARMAAEALAAELAGFPQGALLGDRRSAHEQDGLSLEAAMANELRLGVGALREGAEGAQRFARGAGRGGAPAS